MDVECFHLYKVKRGKINNILLGNMGVKPTKKSMKVINQKSRIMLNCGTESIKASKGLMKIYFSTKMVATRMLDL